MRTVRYKYLALLGDTAGSKGRMWVGEGKVGRVVRRPWIWP